MLMCRDVRLMLKTALNNLLEAKQPFSFPFSRASINVIIFSPVAITVEGVRTGT